MNQSPKNSGAQFTQAEDDNFVLPFQIESAKTSGRVVRLGSVIDDVLSKHDYPESVSILLGEAIALTAMLSASLKFDGKLILQTRSDGPVHFLVVQSDASGKVRGYVNFDRERVEELEKGTGPFQSQLLGNGHLAMTIDQGVDMERYQGIVALENSTLTEAANTYFRDSEQLPTFLKLAVARLFTGNLSKGEQWSWRAGGVLIQNLTSEGGFAEQQHPDEQEDNWPFVDGDEGWNRACHLASTVEDHEMLDPNLTSERLLFRLFHEERVLTFPRDQISAECQCSRERIENMLGGFTTEERRDMKVDGKILVKCEFCSRQFEFSPEQFEDSLPRN